MDEFDIVFEKLTEMATTEANTQLGASGVSPEELDEIEELRRFAADLKQPELPTFTTS